LEGFLGELELPEELMKNFKFLENITMFNVIDVWEKVVHYQRRLETEVKK
jgi:hypothetical protein